MCPAASCQCLQAQRDAAEVARQARIRSPARQLAEMVTARGYRVGRPQFTIGEWRRTDFHSWHWLGGMRCYCMVPDALHAASKPSTCPPHPTCLLPQATGGRQSRRTG